MKDEGQLKIRLPAEMRDWLDDQARRNIRTVTGEVLLAIREKMERSVGERPA